MTKTGTYTLTDDAKGMTLRLDDGEHSTTWTLEHQPTPPGGDTRYLMVNPRRTA